MTPDDVADLLCDQFTTEFRRLMQEHDPEERIDDEYFRTKILAKVASHIINSYPSQPGFEIDNQALDIVDILHELSKDYDADQNAELIGVIADSFCCAVLNPDPADERWYSRQHPAPRFEVVCVNRTVQ